MITEHDLIRMKENGALTDEEYLKALNKLKVQECKNSFWGNLDPEKNCFLHCFIGYF